MFAGEEDEETEVVVAVEEEEDVEEEDDPALKAWLIAEAARRGRGIRTSDVIEDALRRLRDSLLPENDNISQPDRLTEKASVPSRSRPPHSWKTEASVPPRPAGW